MLGRKCSLKTHVRNLGYPLPLLIGAQNHLFGPTSQLNGKFNRLYLRNETRYRQSVKCVDNYKGSPTSSQTMWTLVHKQLQTGPSFLPTLFKFCFLRHCQALQTDTSKRNSTKLSQTVDSKLRQQSAVEKSRSFVPNKLGAQKSLTFVRFFDDFDT